MINHHQPKRSQSVLEIQQDLSGGLHLQGLGDEREKSFASQHLKKIPLAPHSAHIFLTNLTNLQKHKDSFFPFFICTKNKKGLIKKLR